MRMKRLGALNQIIVVLGCKSLGPLLLNQDLRFRQTDEHLPL
jgi:hypothetical protein